MPLMILKVFLSLKHHNVCVLNDSLDSLKLECGSCIMSIGSISFLFFGLQILNTRVLNYKSNTLPKQREKNIYKKLTRAVAQYFTRCVVLSFDFLTFFPMHFRAQFLHAGPVSLSYGFTMACGKHRKHEGKQ